MTPRFYTVASLIVFSATLFTAYHLGRITAGVDCIVAIAKTKERL
jgi:hypothetical protein